MGRMHFRATGPRSIPIKRKYIVFNDESEELEEEVELLKKNSRSCGAPKEREISVFGGTAAPILNQEGLHDIGNLTQWVLCIL